MIDYFGLCLEEASIISCPSGGLVTHQWQSSWKRSADHTVWHGTIEGPGAAQGYLAKIELIDIGS